MSLPHDDHISRIEFQNFREDIKEDFDRVHACNQRIEQRIDEFISKQEANTEKQNEHKFQLKHGFIMTAIAGILAYVAAVFTPR